MSVTFRIINTHRSFTVLLALLFAPSTMVAQRRALNFDRGWRFHLGDLPRAHEPDFDDAGWRTLDVPHDWSIEGAFSDTNPAGAHGGALPGGVGWYRKTFSVPQTDTGRLVFVEFDGVYRNSEVWINGRFLGKRPYGFSSFRYELTPYVRYGRSRNEIVVRVDNSQQPNSRWYSGSGIYRHVRLVTVKPVHVDQWGTYITTPQVSADSARVTIRTTVRNASEADQPITLRTSIYDAAGREVARASSATLIPADSVAQIAHELLVRAPTLWTVDRPRLYRAVSRVTCRGGPCDEYTTPFGVRTFSFDADRGFVLNGQRLKLRGVCLHHDLGALGAAVNTRALERQLQIMKAMGVNALRTSHNPPAPELLDLTDRMGIMVLDEAFDIWKKGKTKYDYHLDWDAWHVRDLSDLVRRDRNHPSVLMWSIGNEVKEQWNDDTTGSTIARELAGIVRTLDPTRPITAADDNVDPSNPLFRSGALDLVGLNYHHQTWADFPKNFPGQKFLATETTSALNTRGYYDQPSDSVAAYGGTDASGAVAAPNANYRISAYDHRRAAWGSLHEESWREIKQYDFLSGMFIWTGFDYLGEPTPYGWPARSSYFGIVDLAGFPKDPYYMYQSEWTDRPVLHLFPHWNWTLGDTIDVWAYTNADEVELFLNGVSLGVRRKANEVFHLMWRVAYAPGTLRAVARRGENVMATDEVKTAGAPARIALVPDRAVIRADGEDLSFVTVTVLDSAGVAVPTADNLISFRIAGRGVARIEGIDNGDEISHAPFKADSVRLFNGKALVIVRAAERAGTATLTADGQGLIPAAVRITVGQRRPDVNVPDSGRERFSPLPQFPRLHHTLEHERVHAHELLGGRPRREHPHGALPRIGEWPDQQQLSPGHELLPLGAMGWKELPRAVHVRRSLVEEDVLHLSTPSPSTIASVRCLVSDHHLLAYICGVAGRCLGRSEDPSEVMPDLHVHARAQRARAQAIQAAGGIHREYRRRQRKDDTRVWGGIGGNDGPHIVLGVGAVRTVAAFEHDLSDARAERRRRRHGSRRARRTVGRVSESSRVIARDCE